MRLKLLLATTLGLALIAAVIGGRTMAEDRERDRTENTQTATAILAGGCFWGFEDAMKRVPGVIETTVGYTGGTIPEPTYRNYHSALPGDRPHVEAIEVRYDTAVISYSGLLDHYFRAIDPTDGEGQSCNRGANYRPVIFTANDAERKTAEAKTVETAARIGRAVEVEILPAATFWPAEEYHQDYYEKHSRW